MRGHCRCPLITIANERKRCSTAAIRSPKQPQFRSEMSETTSATVPPTPTDRLQTLPTFMQRQILAFFGYQDYTLTGRTCHYLHARWIEALQHHRMAGTLFVPTDNCKTLKEAVKQVHGDGRLTTIVLGCRSVVEVSKHRGST